MKCSRVVHTCSPPGHSAYCCRKLRQPPWAPRQIPGIGDLFAFMGKVRQYVALMPWREITSCGGQLWSTFPMQRSVVSWPGKVCLGPATITLQRPVFAWPPSVMRGAPASFWSKTMQLEACWFLWRCCDCLSQQRSVPALGDLTKPKLAWQHPANLCPALHFHDIAAQHRQSCCRASHQMRNVIISPYTGTFQYFQDHL